MMLTAVLALISTSSCKKKVSDTDLKAAIEKALAADPMAAMTKVSVEKGIATITGECKDDACKASCEKIVSAIKGVKSVVNNCAVAPPPVSVVPVANVDALTKAVTDALKDFPGVAATVKDQIATLTGEIAKDKMQKMMMGLNALKSVGLKSIDSKGLVKK
jgi:osmotically-inducible protein OsmY